MKSVMKTFNAISRHLKKNNTFGTYKVGSTKDSTYDKKRSHKTFKNKNFKLGKPMRGEVR